MVTELATFVMRYEQTFHLILAAHDPDIPYIHRINVLLYLSGALHVDPRLEIPKMVSSCTRRRRQQQEDLGQLVL